MPWFQLRLTASKEEAEKLSDLLSGLGAASVTFEDAEDQPLLEPPPGATPLWERIDVVGLFDAKLDQELITAALFGQLSIESRSTIKTEELEDQDWVRAWMDDFHPMKFGESLWIVPSWSDPVDPDATNILLDPGLAFGTGTHPTTALCMEWLDAHPPTKKVVIDYGCGSGILAIAAAKLGAVSVHCVDNDPQALIATLDNGEKNNITARLKGYLPDAFPNEQMAELLIANILAGPLIELAPKLASHLKPGGEIVLSGILQEQADEVSTAYTPWFEMEPATFRQEWTRLEGCRREEP